MDSKDVNLIRDAAIKIESLDLQTAFELMKLASKYRPEGKFIKNKVAEYADLLDPALGPDLIELRRLIATEELAIIPCGLRCFTAGQIGKHLGIKQPSLPFNSGFFSPSSVANVIKNREIRLSYPDKDIKTHNVCIKEENSLDEVHGLGIKFTSSTYNEINDLASSKEAMGINKLLDSTFAYYTLDMKNGYVLAHYNWHVFASKEKSNGIYDVAENIQLINETMNRRIERMFKLCDSAKNVLFVFYNGQNYNYMKVDDTFYFLNDFTYLNKVLKERFGNKSRAILFSDIDTPKKLLNYLDDCENS